MTPSTIGIPIWPAHGRARDRQPPPPPVDQSVYPTTNAPQPASGNTAIADKVIAAASSAAGGQSAFELFSPIDQLQAWEQAANAMLLQAPLDEELLAYIARCQSVINDRLDRERKRVDRKNKKNRNYASG